MELTKFVFVLNDVTKCSSDKIIFISIYVYEIQKFDVNPAFVVLDSHRKSCDASYILILLYLVSQSRGVLLKAEGLESLGGLELPLCQAKVY